MFKNMNFRRQEPQKLTSSSHPIFTPVSIMSHTSLLETDYNLHKSNSTYFSDLDVSRTALVVNLVTPGMEFTKRELDKEVDEKGKKKFPGSLAVLLGSVYCSFKKEVLTYERYEMQSKIAGWDEKWLYVLTYFLRPAKRKGEDKTILAMGISRYVLKKGRLTIRPERILRASGFLPEKPEGESVSGNASVSVTPAVPETPESGEAINASGGLDDAVAREVMAFTESTDLNKVVREKQAREQEWNKDEWTWEKIERERLRGLNIVKGFVNTDSELAGEAWLR